MKTKYRFQTSMRHDKIIKTSNLIKSWNWNDKLDHYSICQYLNNEFWLYDSTGSDKLKIYDDQANGDNFCLIDSFGTIYFLGEENVSIFPNSKEYHKKNHKYKFYFTI